MIGQTINMDYHLISHGYEWVFHDIKIKKDSHILLSDNSIEKDSCVGCVQSISQVVIVVIRDEITAHGYMIEPSRGVSV